MKNVDLKVEKGVATVTLDTPKTFNQLSIEMVNDIIEAFEKIDEDDSVVVAVLTGAGEKAFAAGADINSFMTSTMESSKAMSELGQLVCSKIAFCKVPVIGAVNGVAFGGALELLQACDIRIASEKATFGSQEVAWGLMAGWGGTQRLPYLVGRSDAMKILLTGDVFTAADAYRMGFVSDIYPDAELMDNVYKLAEKIVKNGPANIRHIKRAVSEGADYVSKAGLALENELCGLCFIDGVPRKRAEAFLNKNKK